MTSHPPSHTPIHPNQHTAENFLLATLRPILTYVREENVHFHTLISITTKGLDNQPEIEYNIYLGSDKVTGADLSAVVDEALRRNEWTAANKPMRCFPTTAETTTDRVDLGWGPETEEEAFAAAEEKELC
jgi:hypothetical protein